MNLQKWCWSFVLFSQLQRHSTSIILKNNKTDNNQQDLVRPNDRIQSLSQSLLQLPFGLSCKAPQERLFGGVLQDVTSQNTAVKDTTTVGKLQKKFGTDQQNIMKIRLPLMRVGYESNTITLKSKGPNHWTKPDPYSLYLTGKITNEQLYNDIYDYWSFPTEIHPSFPDFAP